eukprot:m.31752 g.31752  ORF g.31752 m.31752 type:complete len:393 (+) comp12538_c0_seq2:1706-2884(+)
MRAALEAEAQDAGFKLHQEAIEQALAEPEEEEEVEESATETDLQLKSETKRLNAVTDELVDEVVAAYLQEIAAETLAAFHSGAFESLSTDREISNALLHMLSGNAAEVSHFRKFLLAKGGLSDVMLWADIEVWRTRSPDHADRSARERQARYIFLTHAQAPTPPGQVLREQASSATSEHTSVYTPTSQALDEAQVAAEEHVMTHWLSLFMDQPAYRARRDRQLARDSSAQLKQKKLKKTDGQSLKGETATQCRAMLQGPSSALLRKFEKFLSKHDPSSFVLNDLRFWQEVQRYKDMCHTHCERHQAKAKFDAICACFLRSDIGARVQINAPEEIVRMTVERGKRLRDPIPYVFRRLEQHVFEELCTYYSFFTKNSAQLMPFEVCDFGGSPEQ